MDFVEVNFDLEFADTSPDFFLKNINQTIFLWSIYADTPAERREFKRLIKILKAKESLMASIRELTEAGIRVSRSLLIKKLVDHKWIIVSSNEVRFILKTYTIDDIPDFRRKLQKRYDDLLLQSKRKEYRFPTSEFLNLPLNVLHSIELDRINWLDLQAQDLKNKILEINFPGNHLPKLIIPVESFDIAKKAALLKVAFGLKKLAGENSAFFSDKIQNNRNIIQGKAHRLLENEVSNIQRKTSREYREEYAAIFLDKVFNNYDYSILFLMDLASETNNYVLTKYSFENPLHFDFLQSFELLKEVYLKQKEFSNITITSLVEMVVDDLKLYVTEDELKWQVLSDNPDLSEKKYEEIYQSFATEFILKKNLAGLPKIIRYHIKNRDGEDENILIHLLNLNRLLNLLMQKCDDTIKENLHAKWTQKLSRHQFEEGMLNQKGFNRTLRQFIQKEHAFLFYIIRKPSLYRVLPQLETLSPLVTRLSQHGTDHLDKVFNISRKTVLEKIYSDIYRSMTGIRLLIFRFIHWLNRARYVRELKSEPQSSSETESHQTGRVILDNLGLDREEQLKEKLDQLWQAIPTKKLIRKQVDQNIAADTNLFFKDRKDIPIKSLTLITEKNLNRILSQAPFLQAYHGVIGEYVEHRVHQHIYRYSHLRSKVIR